MGERSGVRARNLVSAACLVAALIGLLSAGSAAAAGTASTFTVSGFGDGPGTCSAPDANGSSVCTTLRGAVAQANTQSNAPTIELQAGTFQLAPGNGGQLDLATSMNIVGAGPGGPNGTTIQQTDGKNRVLEVDGTSTLSGVEITGGHYTPPWSSSQTASGGGVLVLGVLSLESSVVSGNEAIGAAGPGAGDRGDPAEGGGIAYGASALAGSAISDSAISGNSALGGDGGTGGARGGDADGGGIAYRAAGPLAIQGTSISSNTATGGAGGGGAAAGGSGGFGEGGGISDRSGVVVQASTIAENTATGGAEGPGPTPSGSSSGFADGGGIVTSGGQLINSTIFDNAAEAGAATTGGTAGSGTGGGVEGDAPELESDTFDANRASSFAGNLDLTVPKTDNFNIDDTIVAGGSPDNCSLFGGSPISSRSYNLEDDAADTCGFSAAGNSLVGVDPQLPARLGDNGGPTPTLAPVPGSPVLRAGGQCQETVDQRGLPRPPPCDIGAFQGQPPANGTLPSITGKPSRGSTLICDPGAWTGDGPPTFSFAWVNNGVPIPGASTNTYVVRAVDAGQGLACQVTASYYGSTKVASPFVIAPSYPVITLLSVAAKPSGVTVNLGCRGPDGRRCRGRLTVSVLENRRGGRVVSLVAGAGPRSVPLGHHGYSILTRHTAAIHIELKRNVGRLLKRFRRIPCLLSVSQTTGLGTSLVTSRRTKIRRAAARRAG